MADRWVRDILGPEFQQRTLPLGEDDEGDVVATLVRHRPERMRGVRPARAILYVHGWSDYFFQTELAQYWTAQGVAFFALDLRKYGRSLREGQTPGYITDLATYDEDIAAAFAVIRGELGASARVMLMGHSTGGLVVSLWANRNPGQISGVVLNSPWLELQGSSAARYATFPAVEGLARLHPSRPFPITDPGFYGRSLAELGVAQDADPEWRPASSWPVRPGWLHAITQGHQQVKAGLSIDAPVLVLASTRSKISPRWSKKMLSSDIVLDVAVIARRSVLLGHTVTVERIPGGIHDLVLSAPPARALVFRAITRWCAGYAWGRT